MKCAGLGNGQEATGVPKVDEKCFEPFCIPTLADQRESRYSRDRSFKYNWCCFGLASFHLHRWCFLLSFIFSNAHNSFHCQVLIGLTKTIFLHQGEHFFWDYAFWDSTFPHWDSNISWIFLVLLEARLLGGDVAPFLDDWLLDLPGVALRPGAHLKEKKVKV